jgi:predicted alpha/beta hydrolase
MGHAGCFELLRFITSARLEIAMKRLLAYVLLFGLCLSGFAFAKEPPAPRDVDISAPDGLKLKATYYAAAKPGPGVLLLHMCNTTRKSWEPVGRQLVAAGINALTMDYRGFGESGGDRFENDPQKQQQVVTEKWPGDVDAALAYLLAQPGVDKNRIGAGGGSCGVNQAVQVARRHAGEVKSLVEPRWRGVSAQEHVAAGVHLGRGRRSVRRRCAALHGVAERSFRQSAQ